MGRRKQTDWVRKLQRLRNRPNLPFHIEQRLDVLLRTASNIPKETDPHLRKMLVQSFDEQWAGYLAEGGTDE